MTEQRSFLFKLRHQLEKFEGRRKRLRFYTAGLLSHSLLRSHKAGRLSGLLWEAAQRADYADIVSRVDYYNKLTQPFAVSTAAPSSANFRRDALDNTIGDTRQPVMGSAYFFDFVRLSDYFRRAFRFDYAFGDIVLVPPWPTFVKSRPIDGANENAVLLKLNELRHFYFVDDTLAFADKLDQAIFRGACHRPHRQRFLEACLGLPNTDIGDIRPSEMGKPSYKAPISIDEHLRYKFIISVEGNDVATNLKWIMSSNSLCFMIKPKYETWFMEGRLQPDHHYVLLKEDYSDLSEKMAFYTAHPEKALQIIANAQQWVAQFKDRQRETLVGLLVMQKYIRLSGQG